MSVEDVFSKIPHPQGYTFPDYALPHGDPVMPIALTRGELSQLLEVYDRFSDVDPTGMESNPFLEAANEFLKQSFGATFTRPDEGLHDDVGDVLTDFSNDLGGEAIGVVDATPKHHRSLYFFLVGCRGYHSAPHVRFDLRRKHRDAVSRLRTGHGPGRLSEEPGVRTRVKTSPVIGRSSHQTR